MNKPKPRQATKTPVKAKVQSQPKVTSAKPSTSQWLAAMPNPVRVVVTIIVILLVVFLGRGWVRTDVVPKTTGFFYRHGLLETYNQQATDLNNPLKLLGITTATETRPCNLQQAQDLHEEVDCTISELGYTELPTTSDGMATTVQTANNLSGVLQLEGWHAGSNGVTLSSLVTGISQGKDYSPDAYYEKVVNHDDCVFDVMIAYSNPQPPAIRAQFSCDRTVNVLGAPKHEIYNSSKGHF